MKSEELELSLRTEFENYLKNILADMKQEVAKLQQNIEDEAEKHKSQLEDVFRNTLGRIESDKQLDEGFKDAVLEHLRLAKDEGARITVTAMAEAEEMDRSQVVVQEPSDLAIKLRDAISDISTKQSQAEILKALVRHSEEFAPRGVFFIIKNEHFVGWRTFGKDKGETEETVREVFFPTSSQSLLSEANNLGITVSNSTSKGDDASLYLEKLGFEKADKMYAVPLVVRGRGVATLYADSGSENSSINIEAIEAMARVASLTVELLASARSGASRQVEEKTTVAETPKAVEMPAEVEETPRFVTAELSEPKSFITEAKEEFTESIPEPVISPVVEETVETSSFEVVEETVETSSFEVVEETVETPTFETVEEKIPSFSESFVSDDDSIETVSTKTQDIPSFATESWGKPKVDLDDYSSSFSTTPTVSISSLPTEPTQSEYQFENTQIESTPAFEPPKSNIFNDYSTPVTETVETFESYSTPKIETESFTQTEVSSFKEELNSFEAETPSFEATSFTPSFEPPTAPVVEEIVKPISTPPVKPRFGDKNVDLPIDVAEDERRLHNDARRFARLLVSEIKLYNEQKVKEGRETSDLYERLREAIDRSREMYDKRVQPVVASKFDYFHYELVNTLAEGEEVKLGSSYPGATV